MKDRFTTIFDGTDIDISNTKNRRMNKLLFCASKYNVSFFVCLQSINSNAFFFQHCCMKIMIGISFTGLIVHYSGPHIGTSHDAK